jgi:hypothetical protein
MRVLLLSAVACSSVAAPSRSASSIGAIEGRVTDAGTGEVLAGVGIDLWCTASRQAQTAITDEHGRYRVELQPDACKMMVHFGIPSTKRTLVIEPGKVTRLDFAFPHDVVVEDRRFSPPVRCPSSPPGAVIAGHTTSQADIDAVVAAVLGRFVTDRTTVPDAALLGRGDVRVATELVATPKRALDARRLPPRFVGATPQELRDEANRLGDKVTFLWFGGVDSDGSCALVTAGVDIVRPNGRHARLCCCSAEDLYEKRRGTWQFVRRLGTTCS